MSIFLGLVTLAAVAALLANDVFPALFPAGSHDLLAAFSLGMVAVAYLIYQAALRPGRAEFAKAALLAAAFLFWAANQIWTNPRQAILLNDAAVALFILDVFLVIVGWPRASANASFAEAAARSYEEERL